MTLEQARRTKAVRTIGVPIRWWLPWPGDVTIASHQGRKARNSWLGRELKGRKSSEREHIAWVLWARDIRGECHESQGFCRCPSL